jgi:hypothetical protein
MTICSVRCWNVGRDTWLDLNAANLVAEQWWTASEVVQAFPDDGAVR